MNLSRQTQKRDKFVSFMESLAELSTCKRARTAALILDEQFTRVYSIGYNGVPAGADNDSCTGVPKRCGCVHAEANALIKLRTESSDLVMMSMAFPCYHCAGLIVNSRQIKRIMWQTPYDMDNDWRVHDWFINAGIETVRLL